MKVISKTEKEKSILELVIAVDGAEFEVAIDKIYKKQRGGIAIPGFRKGKAPRKIIEAMYGTNVFYEDAINEVYPKAYAEAMEQEKLDAVAYPTVEVVEVGKDGLTFKAMVTLKPAVKLASYVGITAPKAEVKITAADEEAELAPFIQRATRLVSVTRKAKKGDTVVLDFEGFDNGVAFEGGKGTDYSLELGSGSFVPGFEDGVVGMKAGDEKEISLTFPADYTPELAGKPVVFKVKAHEVKEHVTPVLDDEFAKDVSEFDTMADLKKSLKEKLQERRDQQATTDFERAVTDQLIDGMEVELPDAMVDFQADKMMEDYAMRITGQGIKFEDYLSMMGMSVQGLREEAKIGARRKVLNELALEAVAAAEKIKVSAKDKTAEYKRLAEEYSMDVEQVKTAVPEGDLEHDLLLKAAAQFVFDNAKVGKAPAKKAAPKADKVEGDVKAPAKKAPAKKAAPKAEVVEGEEKPKKAPAKKTPAKKTEE